MADSHIYVLGNCILKSGDVLRLFLTHSRANPWNLGLALQSPPVVVEGTRHRGLTFEPPDP